MTIKKEYFVLLSIIVFIVALSQPAYCIDNKCGLKWGGLISLVSGALGFYTGEAALTWLANPLLIVSWITFFNFKKASFILSIGATGLGLHFLNFNRIMINEGGGYGQITGHEIGYWLWVSSMVIILIANVFSLIMKD